MITASSPIENLLTERQVAEMLSISVATLRRWRSQKKPPEWTKLGSSVRYRTEAIRHFVEESHRATQASAGGGR